jgi:O-antigen ligase/tetratricopeptide (TPR) repeat protein
VKNAKAIAGIPASTGEERTMRFLLLAVFGAVCFAVAINANDSTFFKPVMLILGTVLLVATGLFFALRSSAITFRPGILHLLAGAYLLASAVSMVASLNASRSLEALAWLSCYIVAFLVTAAYASNRGGIRTLLHGMAIITAIAVAYGLYQHLSPDPFLTSVVSKERSVLSTLCNAMYFGGFLVMMLPVALSLGWSAPPDSVRRILYGILVLAIVYSVVITESRSAWIGAVAGVLLFGILSVSSLRMRLIVVGLIVAAILIAYAGMPDVFERRFGELMYGGNTSSFSRRLIFYQAAWNAFLHSPVIGNGIGTFAIFAPRFRSPHYWMSRSEDIVPHVHNEPLQILSEAGLLGMITFLALLVSFVVVSIRVIRTAPQEIKIIQTGLLASVAAILVDNLASLDLRTFPVALGFWMILGITAATAGPAFTFRRSIAGRLRALAWVSPIAALAFFAWYVPIALARYGGEQDLLEANTHHYQGAKKEAVAAYRKALGTIPENPEALIFLANDLLPANPAEARQSLQRLLEIHPYYPKARILLAITTLQLGDTASAFREINDELLIEDSPDAVYYASSIAYRARRRDAELQYLHLLFVNAATAHRYDHVPVSLERLVQIASAGGIPAGLSPVLDSLRLSFTDDPDILVPLAEVYAAIGESSKSLATAKLARELPSVRENQRGRISRLLSPEANRRQ